MFLKKLLLGTFASLLVSGSALAHLKIGTYKGLTAEGQQCAIQIVSISFENNVRNPLNERVVVKSGNLAMNLSHPVVVGDRFDSIEFDHDYLKGHIGTSEGAALIILEMSHDTKKEGPERVVTLQHNWITNSAQKTECSELTFAE